MHSTIRHCAAEVEEKGDCAKTSVYPLGANERKQSYSTLRPVTGLCQMYHGLWNRYVIAVLFHNVEPIVMYFLVYLVLLTFAHRQRHNFTRLNARSCLTLSDCSLLIRDETNHLALARTKLRPRTKLLRTCPGW